MDRKIQGMFIAGIALTLIAFLFSFYAAAIIFILFAVLIMSLLIMQDSASFPNVVVELKDDAKSVIIRNAGNSDAVKVHVALVPINIEFDILVLAPDQVNEYPLESMLAEAKAIATFENVMGNTFSKSYSLTASGNEYDPLKPMIPLFRWK